MFKAEFNNQSLKFIDKCASNLQKRIIEKIESLQKEPVLHDSKKVVGEKNLFRVRVGDYRILYEIQWQENIILIDRIDKRSKMY